MLVKEMTKQEVTMDNSNEKLTKKEYLELIVEGGIGAIPYIGGVVQSLYFWV